MTVTGLGVLDGRHFLRTHLPYLDNFLYTEPDGHPRHCLCCSCRKYSCPYVTSGVHLIGPSKAILYGFSEPVTAAIVTFFFMGSPFTVFDGIGFLCVFLMLVLISMKQPVKQKMTDN